MKTQEVIASVIDAQKEEIDKTPEGLPREILDDVPVIENPYMFEESIEISLH